MIQTGASWMCAASARSLHETGRDYVDARSGMLNMPSVPRLPWPGCRSRSYQPATLASLAVFGAHHRKFSAQRPR